MFGSGAVNPDFSQVEADARQLDVNQPFALFYQEKRPFFTEGSDFFSSPFRVIYTRTLRDPRWGLKLSGKEGANTVGAYVVQDELTNLIFPGSQGSGAALLDRVSSGLVLRYKRDLGSRYTLGALFTDRSGDNYFNRVYGVDGMARFGRSDKMTFQLLGSSTRYPEEVALDHGQPPGTLGGHVFGAQYEHQGRRLNGYVEYDEADLLFRADLGFMPRVDYRELEGGVSWSWYRDQGWWSRIQVGSSFEYSEDREGRFLYRNHSLNFFFRGAMQTFSVFYLNRSRESYGGRAYDLWSGELYTANITQGSAIFHLNLRTFFRAILQHVDYRYNAANYTFPVEPEERHFFSQWLFSYRLNPRTVLFLGYSDNALGTQEYPLTRSDRTIFMKLSYSWQI
ncbi:MAG: hypothetical protein JXO51_02300 [Candidatus Aminicenantes bacterium]|nr:hypothetical protein [Candidatus Aminicenantes bacterium]